MDDIDRTIFFSSPDDPRTGFMSNASRHGFNISGKRWMTVEHYISALKFEGTLYEETIRKAPSVFQVRRMMKEKKILSEQNGKITKISVYGPSNNYYVREDWEDVKLDVYRRGMEAKFKNPSLSQKLLETGDSKLVDTADELVGPILEDIRKNIVLSHKQVKKEGPKKITDFPRPSLNSKEKEIVENVIQVTWRVARHEGWEEVQTFPEMIYDAIKSIVTKSQLYDEIMSYLDHILSLSWTDIYSNFPHLQKIISYIKDIYTTSDPQQKTVKGSIIIATFLLWYSNSSHKKYIEKRCQKVRTIPICISPGKRDYRSLQPPHPITIKKKSISIPSKIELIENESHFFIIGRPLKDPSVRFIYQSLGGKYSKENTKITFPLSKLSEIKQILYQQHSFSEQYQFLYLEWVEEVMKDFLVAANVLSKLIKKDIDVSMMKYVVQDIYCYDFSESHIYFNYDHILSRLSTSLSKKVKKYLFHSIDNISQQNILNEKKYISEKEKPPADLFFSTEDVSSQQIIRVLSHIQSKLSSFTQKTNKKIYEYSVCILISVFPIHHTLREILKKEKKSKEKFNESIASLLPFNKKTFSKISKLYSRIERHNHQ